MLNLELVRDVVKANKPFDTGFMFMFGARFNETENYLCVYYDSTAVPYIVHNELGHRNNPNEGFISVKTVGALNLLAGQLASGDVSQLQQIRDHNRLQSSLISNSVMEYLTSYGKVAGLTYEHYTG